MITFFVRKCICGEVPIVEYYTETALGYHVVCDECGLNFNMVYDTPKEAIESWNDKIVPKYLKHLIKY